MRKIPPPPSAEPPDGAQLRAVALTHLARFAATEAGLRRVLMRTIDRWLARTETERERAEQLAAASRQHIDAIVLGLVASGAISDAAFAESRARALIRAGRSRRAASAHLAARGVAPDLAAAALPDNPGHELAAALIHARKRRFGPWRQGEASPDDRRRELASLARAGFGHAVAAKALRFGREDAEALITSFRAAL